MTDAPGGARRTAAGTARLVPASVGQRLLWLMEQYRGGGTLNSHLLYRVRGPLDLPLLQRAATVVWSRHDALRTTFRRSGGQLWQVVTKPGPVRLERRAIGEGPAGGSVDEVLRTQISGLLRDPLDLARDTTRSVVFELGPQDHALAFVMHHLVTDGWSGMLLSAELGAAYAWLRGDGAPLAPVAWQYADFVTWQAGRLDRAGQTRLQRAWRGELEGLALPRLPGFGAGDRAQARPDRGRMDRGRMGIVRRELPPETVARLAATARARGTSLFVIALAGFFSVLHRRGGQRDLAVASLMANRTHRAARGSVGFFANMVVLRARFTTATTLADVVDATRRGVLWALVHQEIPFQLLPLDLFEGLPGRPDDIVFQMVPGPARGLSVDGLAVTPIPAPAGVGSRFGLEFLLLPDPGDGYILHTRYAADRLDGSWVEGLVTEYLALLADLAADVHTPLAAPSVTPHR
jgi:hypothetical protein